MDKSAVLDIALSCNAAYVPGALQVLASLSTRAKPETRLRFHVFTEDVGDETVSFMRQLLARLHPKSELRHYACDGRLLEDLPAWKGSRIAAVRCRYAQEMHDVDWCLHVDCDVLYLARVEEHFALRDESVYACAVVEQDEGTSCDERDWISRHVTDGKSSLEIGADCYFNSGVLLMNLKKMREDGMPGKLLAFLRAHPDVPSPDQDALNVVLGGCVKMLPIRYNLSQLTLTDELLRTNPVIHYVSGVPWLASLMGVANNRFWLWHSFADRYVWEKRGESVRRSFGLGTLALKIACYRLLKCPAVGLAFAWSLEAMGRVWNGRAWRHDQVACDISRRSAR